MSDDRPRRAFGEKEDDEAPDLTRPELAVLLHEIHRGTDSPAIIAHSPHGGVTRLLEQAKRELEGGGSYGRRTEWIVVVLDLSHSLQIVPALIKARNQIISALDQIFSRHGLERNFIVFEQIVDAWWRIKRGGKVDPPYVRSATARTFKALAKLSGGGVISEVGELFEAASGAEITDNDPFNWASDLIAGRAAEALASQMRDGIAAGALRELRRGKDTNPDVLENALPHVLLSAVRQILNDQAEKNRRLAPGAAPLRFMLMIDAGDHLDSVAKPAARAGAHMRCLVEGTHDMADGRTVIGARSRLKPWRRAHAPQVKFKEIELKPVPRVQIRDRLANEIGAADATRLVDAMSPVTHESVHIWPYSEMWQARGELPVAAHAADLCTLAHSLAPGRREIDAVIAEGRNLIGDDRMSQIAQYVNGPNVWFTRDGDNSIRVNPRLVRPSTSTSDNDDD